jgi:ribosomal protein L11 methylase PrmA
MWWSNILRLVNVALLPDVRTGLSPGGIAIFSGMEEREAVDFRLALGDERFHVQSEIVDNGWWAVAAGQR